MYIMQAKQPRARAETKAEHGGGGRGGGCSLTAYVLRPELHYRYKILGKSQI